MHYHIYHGSEVDICFNAKVSPSDSFPGVIFITLAALVPPKSDKCELIYVFYFNFLQFHIDIEIPLLLFKLSKRQAKL